MPASVRSAWEWIESSRVPRYLQLRLLAIHRLVRDEWDGAPLATGVTLLVVIGGSALVARELNGIAASNVRNAFALAGSNMLVMLALHRARRDAVFLHSAGISTSFVYSVDYLLASTPALAVLLVQQRWLAAFIALAIALAVARLPTIESGAATTRRIALPAGSRALAFEWIAAARRSWWLVALMSVSCGLGLTVVRAAVWPSVVAIGLLALLGVDAFLASPAEGWPMVEAFAGESSASRFLARKLLVAISVYAVVALVPLAVLSIGGMSWPRLVPALLVAAGGSMLVMVAALLKYALYREGRRPAPVVAGVALVGWTASLVYLPPAALLFAGVLWRRAVMQVVSQRPSHGTALVSGDIGMRE